MEVTSLTEQDYPLKNHLVNDKHDLHLSCIAAAGSQLRHLTSHWQDFGDLKKSCFMIFMKRAVYSKIYDV